jgi:hypothetical protein
LPGGHAGEPMNQGNPTRILAIDLSRGLAVSLMILSHGVKGLLSFDQFPEWGLVPIHLITKFSSTIFFMTFGLSLAVSFAPSTQNSALWPQKRKKLVLRGLIILFWYKVLTIIEMSHLHNPGEIFDALIYRDFPSYAEILGFYALALLWIPFLLPLWQRSSRWIKGLWPIGFVIIAFLISRYFDFGESQQMKALLVEDDDYYTWGQISRAPLVFLGMFMGAYLIHNYSNFRRRLIFSGVLAGFAAILISAFITIYDEKLYTTLEALALNEGKHPPELSFVLFSLAGAIGVFALTFLIGDKGAKWLAPFTLIGKDTLSAFIFHLTVLFVIYRYLLDLWLKVSYGEALGLTALLIAMTAVWIKFKIWRKNYEEYQVPSGRPAHPRNLKPRELPAN